MVNTEIKVNSKEIQESITRLNAISAKLETCAQRKLLLSESAGKTAEETEHMFQEVLSVVNAMRDLVEQTITLVEGGDKKFKKADRGVAGRITMLGK